MTAAELAALGMTELRRRVVGKEYPLKTETCLALIDRVEALEAALRQADAALLSVAAFLPLFAADEAKVHRAQIAHGQYTEARQAIRAALAGAQ